jgi:hypothetical protein
MAAKKANAKACRHVRRILVALRDRHGAVDLMTKRIA